MHDEFYSLTGKLKNISEFIWFFFCQGEGALEIGKDIKNAIVLVLGRQILENSD